MDRTLPRNARLHPLTGVDTGALPPDGGPQFNRLIFEQSPYLLQHACNPVDWYPWGEEAFARARELDRPVFLSIGYATCHWCHVMEHESFEDAEVAAFLNRYFVAIKVDREERPDLDQFGMSACQLISGQGGWPLTLLLTPEKVPFFATTYVPKQPRSGMYGLLQLLAQVAGLWRDERQRVLSGGAEIVAALRQSPAPAAPGQLDNRLLETALQQLRGDYDAQYGGFGATPKFPAAHNLALLLRLARRCAAPDAADMAVTTLQAIRRGGIFDQLGGGVHRYSVDARWLVPHFEKMLYDQALLALAALDAWQAVADPVCAELAGTTLDYVLRDLALDEGGFACGEDADSEGAEGSYYLWSLPEIAAILGPDAGDLFSRCYGVTAQGNFDGRNILHLPQAPEVLARELGLAPEVLTAQLAGWRAALLAERRRRVPPLLDDKVLTGWNGLAVAALARGGVLLQRPEWTARAGRCAEFLLQQLRQDDGRLLRRWRRGAAAIPAFIDDYAGLLWGVLELYQATWESRWLATALDLASSALELFVDGAVLSDCGRDSEPLPVRIQSSEDGALPSGAALLTAKLLHLGRLCGRDDLENRALALLAGQIPRIARYPRAYGYWLQSLCTAVGPRYDLLLCVPAGAAWPQAWLTALHRRFEPQLSLVLAADSDDRLRTLAPGSVGRYSRDGRITAWLCRDRTCLPPVTTLEALLALLDEVPER